MTKRRQTCEAHEVSYPRCTRPVSYRRVGDGLRLCTGCARKLSGFTINIWRRLGSPMPTELRVERIT